MITPCLYFFIPASNLAKRDDILDEDGDFMLLLLC